ncbi:HAMP domain-containing protein [Lachnospiraceae bacterium NE2001]|nr:HAMP domain-containing protein [Lachnospiraceae bacterium NE2001]
MKSYIKIVMVVASVYLIGVILLIIVTGNLTSGNNGTKGEVSALNDIARTAESNQSDLSVLDEYNYGFDYVIVDMTQNILYTNSAGDLTQEKITVETAIQNRYPYIYLKSGDKIWGCLIELDDGLSSVRRIRKRFIIGISLAGLVIILAMAGFGLYINQNVIAPFRNMKDFAGKVAQGNLDEPLAMDRGNMFGAFSESFDIMREELAQSRRRELELQKKERELVASLSHDLKTPVTGIKLTAELMQMRLSVKKEQDPEISYLEQEKQKEIAISSEEMDILSADAEGIRQKAEQIDALVSDLFASTLDDLGEFKVTVNDEDSSVITSLVESYDNRKLVTTEEVPKVVLSIDKNRMGQVIGNIISNSYKYADTKIDISYRLSEGYLEMEIKDYGPGVPSEELDLITNKFYRGKNWQDTDKDGNGLGLYIAKTLMQKMNGDLVAESDGYGLSVTLIIPLS